MADVEEQTVPYREYLAARRTVLGGLLIGLVGLVLVAISVGPTTIPIRKTARILLAGPGGSSTTATILWEIRVPRALGALVIGAGLSVSGAVMQSVLNNPLGSPYTLGISHAAMFGASLTIVALGGQAMTAGSGTVLSVVSPYTVSIVAFLMGLVSTGVIVALATYRSATPETMILTGIALGSLFTAGTTALQYVATQEELASLVYWSFGDVGRTTWRSVGIMAAVLGPSLVYFLRRSWAYNALDAGDEAARGVGVNVEAVRNRGMILSSLVTALTVSFVGIIGFVGLVVPHIVRKTTGNNKEFLLPISTVLGGILLLASDTAARTVFSPTVIPVGIVTSFIGAPFFIYLVIRGREYWTE